MADVVNVGQAPNDGTGVDYRAAFIAINAAFLAVNAANARALSVASLAATQSALDDALSEITQLQEGKADRIRRAVQDQSITALTSDVYLGVSALTMPRTITLPLASSFPTGQPLYIADESGACSATMPITIAAAGADTIAGQASVSMGSPYQKLAFHSNGSNLWTVA